MKTIKLINSIWTNTFLGADYMESFQPGLSFIPVSRAEISARPKDKILLKHSKRLHDQNSSPG
jgi:hypothetical protein